jgi:hypothetical protein
MAAPPGPAPAIAMSQFLTTSRLTLAETCDALSCSLEVYAKLSQPFFQFLTDDTFSPEQAHQQLAQTFTAVSRGTSMSSLAPALAFRLRYRIASPNRRRQRLLTRESFAPHGCSASANTQAIDADDRRNHRSHKLTGAELIHRNRRRLTVGSRNLDPNMR